MSDEELIETLRAFEKNRVENLNESARNVFNAIIKIADERDLLQQRIDKAIETIKALQHSNYFKKYIERERDIKGNIVEYDIPLKYIDGGKIIDILKGSDTN